MAEVLGTVVGVVSLGLQVCSGLNVYIDGLQCRREEIESTIRHQKSLETLVTQIEGLHNRRQTPGICSAPLQESMASAKAELLLLDEFISKIRIEDVNGTDKSAGEMMKIQKKRLLYPFRRDRLDRLVTRLDVVIKALQAALQVFELEASLETKNFLDQVLQTVSRSEVTVLGIERKIDENASLASHEMKNSLEQFVQTVSRSELKMLSIERKIDENASMARLPDYATKEDVMELKTLMAGLMSSSATGTLKNMVSKPSALKVICDNMTNLETISRTNGSSLVSSNTVTNEPVCQETDIRSQFHCTCNPRRIVRRQKRSFGPVSFAKEAVTKRAHVSGCPFAIFDTQKTNSWSASITFRMFRGLVAAAVDVSLAITTGAGGLGMSPSFTYFPLRESSPAFEVVDALSMAFGVRQWALTDEEVTKIFERGIHTLKTIFTSKASSPFEIDANGDTLLHVACGTVMSAWINHLDELVEFLLAIGVPRDRPNQNDQ
ncbi:hypothetical protein CGCSCA4_v007030 [Colletotrichum siamense]|uniref:Ankyrin repeat protein n=1 Tax=Colletotrichum siamense TaxID=690259 RepID=A0A9P5ETY3_COLSI|nr:hypothetical protein CGCSCA4_v007030 [Colletotrichum siamense]KAF4859921.1 hypothetical protein CGCSCA2_v005911 [Colletotrichum siamense]